MRIMAMPAYRNRTGNPYNWLLYKELEKLGHTVVEASLRELLKRPSEILHLHWPDFLLSRKPWPRALTGGLYLLLLVTVAKLRGARVIWTAHNLHSHERPHPRTERLFMELLVRQLHACIALSETGLQRVREVYSPLVRKPGFIVPHGHYQSVYPVERTRQEARAKLGLSKSNRVLLFIGQIRPYKNVPALAAAFSGLEAPDLRLLIAGKPSSTELDEALCMIAARDPRIVFRPGFVADDELQDFFAAADLVVLPYQEVLNSGSAILALSFRRPVLLPDRGAMAELAELFGSDWVKLYRGELTAGDLLTALEAACDDRRAEPDLELDVLAWSRLAKATENVYAALLPTPPAESATSRSLDGRR